MKKDDLTFTNLVKNLQNCPVRVLLQPIYTGEPSGKNHPSVVSSSKKKTKKKQSKNIHLQLQIPSYIQF